VWSVLPRANLFVDTQWACELSKVSVLLADDHPNFPKLVENLLKPEFEVVGIVCDGESLVEASLKLNPDIIVTDISMPVLSGFGAADRLRESGSTAKVIFLTVHSDPDFVRAGLATGALGYVVKPRVAADLSKAIREVLGGHVFISPDISTGN
jgi:DNA-binding NarL/FixJ family response regulator